MTPPQNNPPLALAWILTSVLAATGMTIAVRLLTPDLHSAMLAFLRSAFGLLVLLPMVVRPGGRGERVTFRQPWLHIARGGCFAIALNLGFYALWHLPLATATILFFLAPIFVTLLAGPLLGERVGPRRWLAVAAGFLGALIILRPDAGTVNLAMLGTVVSTMAFAIALLIGKILGRENSSRAIFVSTTATVAVFTLPPALFVWDLPGSLWQWGIVMGLVVCSNLRTWADIRAYAVGEAGFLAPFSYLRLISVGTAGYILFHETIDSGTWIGGAIIVAATLFIALREAQMGRGGRGPSSG